MKIPEERLKEWWSLVHTPYQFENPAVKAGRDAEAWLQSYFVTHANYRGSYLFAGKRVKSHNSKGKKEIDLIVVTPKKLPIIEAKNWSGELKSKRDGSWLHIRRDGEHEFHPNMVAYNDEKKTSLLEYLGKIGLTLSESHVSQKIIFTNRNLKIEHELYKNPNIITQNKLGQYLNRQKRKGFSEKLVCSVIEYCLSSENAEIVVDGLFSNMTHNKFIKVASAVNQLSNWDRIDFYGTRILTGDLISIKVGTVSYNRHQMKSGDQIKVQWTRNKIFSLAKAMFNFGSLGKLILPGIGKLQLSTTDYIFFHPAGQPEPQQIPLTYIERITLG